MTFTDSQLIQMFSFYFQFWMSLLYLLLMTIIIVCFFCPMLFYKNLSKWFCSVEIFEYQPGICCICFTIDSCTAFVSVLIIIGVLRFVVLYSLNIENCSITSRTIQKVADALGAESTLAQLCIGTFNKLVNYNLPNIYLLLRK